MNSNIKEIGHVAFRVKDKESVLKYYKEDLGLNVGFILKTKTGMDRIVYYQLNHGHFIELFPECDMGSWPDYDGKNPLGKYSYFNTTIGKGNSTEIHQDPEENRWIVNDGERYISKVTYYCNNLQYNKKFYTDILELELAEEDENHVVIQVNAEQQIELLNKHYTDSNNCEAKGFHHFALIVNDIAKMADFCVEKGVQLYNGNKARNNPYTKPYEPVKHSEKSYNFWIQDYEDNEIEVMAYSPESYQLIYAAK